MQAAEAVSFMGQIVSGWRYTAFLFRCWKRAMKFSPDGGPFWCFLEPVWRGREYHRPPWEDDLPF